MKIFKNMSKRDQLLLLLILVIAVGGSLYYLGYVKQGEKITQLNSEKANLQQAYDEALNNAAKLSHLIEQVKEYRQDSAVIATQYHSNLDQEEYIVKINQLIASSKVIINTVSYINDIRIIPLPDEKVAATQEQEIVFPEEHNIGLISIYDLKFSCNYTQLLELLRLINEDPKKMACTSLSVNTQSTGSGNDLTLECGIGLAFYYLTDLEEFTIDENYVNILIERANTVNNNGSNIFTRNR